MSGEFDQGPPPSKDRRDRTVARNRAQNHFATAEARTTLVKQMVESERAAVANKTAKLRALRLAKEEADRAAALLAPPAVPARKRTKAAAKAPAKA